MCAGKRASVYDAIAIDDRVSSFKCFHFVPHTIWNAPINHHYSIVCDTNESFTHSFVCTRYGTKWFSVWNILFNCAVCATNPYCSVCRLNCLKTVMNYSTEAGSFSKFHQNSNVRTTATVTMWCVGWGAPSIWAGSVQPQCIYRYTLYRE